MWTRVDTGLRDHRKIRKLSKILEVEEAHALGLVVNFWLYSLNNWGHGQVEQDPDEVAHACCWKGDATDLTQALFDVGFLDVDMHGNWLIHDWDMYGGKYIKQVERNRDRAANWRNEKKERAADAKEIAKNLDLNFSDLVDKKSL